MNNVTVVTLFGISLFIRLGGEADRVPIALIFLSGIALGLLSVSGWLGGKLSYRYGVPVVDETTQMEGYAT